MMYELDGPRLPEDNTLPASINMDFNGDEDQNILASTKDFCYWWKNVSVSKVDKASVPDLPRVTRSVTAAHFKEFLKKARIPFCYISFQSTSIFYDRPQQISSKSSKRHERSLLT